LECSTGELEYQSPDYKLMDIPMSDVKDLFASKGLEFKNYLYFKFLNEMNF